MANFRKRDDAPEGDITVGVANADYVFTDGGVVEVPQDHVSLVTAAAGNVVEQSAEAHVDTVPVDPAPVNPAPQPFGFDPSEGVD